MLTQKEWEKELRRIGVIWQHDGHPDRPYALLTSGKISDTFFDLSYALAFPAILKHAADHISEQIHADHGATTKDLIICGQMSGSVGIALMVAERLGADYLYTIKDESSEEKKMLLDPRFEGIHDTARDVLLIEDVVTTARTSSASDAALNEAGFDTRNTLYTVVSRVPSGLTQGFMISGCYTPRFEIKTWDRGQNPYTMDGSELVEPLRPKTAEARQAMRHVYA